jgi:hypothetical protein
VQEAHQFLLHALMDEIEAKLASSPASPLPAERCESNPTPAGGGPVLA